METMTTIRIIVICLVFMFGANAQSIGFLQQVRRASQLSSAVSDPSAMAPDREKAAKQLLEILMSVLSQPESFDYPFDELPGLSKIVSQNKRIRLFTWPLKLDDATYHYFGIIQRQYDIAHPILLKDISAQVPMTELMSLRDSDWFGCIYYNILDHTTQSGDTVYILFGYDINDPYTHKKIIDVVNIDPSGQTRFGLPVFKHPDGYYYRRIFEFDARAGTRVNYDKDLEMIVFNHLIPLTTLHEEPPIEMITYTKKHGKIKTKKIKTTRPQSDLRTKVRYVPDGSFAGYKLIKGQWEYIDKIWNTQLGSAPRPKPVLTKKKDLFGH